MTVFKKAMDKTLPGACKPGKQAMAHADHVSVNCSKGISIACSVNLDEATREKHPRGNRWDYGLSVQAGRKESIVWIESHHASTSAVSVMLKKRDWLKDWLIKNADDIWRKMGSRFTEQNCLWLASGAIDIPRHTRQYKILASRGFKPMKTIKFTQSVFDMRP